MTVTRHSRKHHQLGASLLELTCAIFILITGAFGAMHMQLVCFDKTNIITEYDAADRAIENEIETLRALPFAMLEAGEQLEFRSDTPTATALPNAQSSVSIAREHNNIPGLARVTVRFSWTGEHGRTIQRQVTTLIAKKE